MLPIPVNLPKFQPSDPADPEGPGNDGKVSYPSLAAYETHQWFTTTSTLYAAVGALAGAFLGGSVGAGLGAAIGSYIGNRTPPA